MEIRHFKLVVAVAETGSLSAAAGKLFLTQSALSHQLKELEDQLGFRLFSRINKRLVFSPSGKLFLDHAVKILAQVEELKTELDSLATGESGMIRLVTESATGHHWLPRILRAYYAEFPNVDVQLHTGISNQPIEMLLSGKADVAIMHRVRPEKNIAYIEVFMDETIALMSGTDPLSRKKFITANDFRNATYITHSRPLEESAFFEGFLKPQHAIPKKVIHVELTEAAVAMAEEGLGVTVMANWLAKPYIDQRNLAALRITHEGLQRKWFIATLNRDHQPKYLNRFIHFVRSALLATKDTAISKS